MTIDVAINSCGRTDVLEFSVNSMLDHIVTTDELRLILLEDKIDDPRRDDVEFSVNSMLDHIVTTDELRLILLEDKIDDPRRDDARREWIERNKHLFSEVHFSKEKLGVNRGLTAMLDLIKSDIFIRQEDDNIFIKKIYIDPIIDMMRANREAVAKVQWKRSIKNVFEFKGQECEIDGIGLISIKIYGNCAGIFNKEWAVKIMKATGGNWSPPKKVALPGMMKLRGETRSLNYYLGSTFDIPTCVHLGKLMDYKKGRWK